LGISILLHMRKGFYDISYKTFACGLGLEVGNSWNQAIDLLFPPRRTMPPLLPPRLYQGKFHFMARLTLASRFLAW